MNVSLDPKANTTSEPLSTASGPANAQAATQQHSQARAAKATATPTADAQVKTVSSHTQVSAQPSPTNYGEIPQTNVTFRRDDAGQIYYVLTDAESGKEIREVPPAEIRKVGEGIAEFLKQEAAKGSTTTHVKVKA